MKPRPLPPLAYIESRLDYSPATGEFRHRHCPTKDAPWNAKWAGKPAGTPRFNGYTLIKIDFRYYQAARIAWLLMTGEDPGTMQIDHINQDKSDNRWGNLRIATPSQNRINVSKQAVNTSGFKGVTRHKRDEKWQAAIRIKGKVTWLGYFNTPEEAHQAYCAAAAKHHGSFANFG